jgi:hypothetical protein
VLSPRTLLFSASPIEDKTEGRHFDTFEAIEAESQAMLNTLTEHDFQYAFKDGRSTGNGAHARKGTTLRVIVAIKLKVDFLPFIRLHKYFRELLIRL